MKYPEIAQRVFHTPLLVAPSKAAAFVRGLGPRITGSGSIEIDGFDPEADAGPSNKPYASLLDDRLGAEIRAGQRDAYRMIDGVAVIPVTGALIHRGAWVGSFSGETTYEGIGAQIDAAVEDRSVRGIALEIDSHGGEVAGCFDLADRIRAARSAKPVHAFICDHSYSAAFALASQADHVVIPRAGGAGSIGVICLHMDRSAQLEALGLTVSVISAGERKGDANPYEPLPDGVRDRLQGEMEHLRQIFAETVSEGRGGRMDVQQVLDTEAGCFLGQEAVDRGLADEVGSPREAFERFVAQINGQAGSSPIMTTSEGKKPMSTLKKGKAGGKVAASSDQVETPEAEDENLDANADVPEGTEAEDAAPEGGDGPEENVDDNVEGDPDGGSDGDGAEASAIDSDPLKRAQAILDCPEAEGREELAKELAFNQNMPLASAKSLLSKAPKGQVAGSLSTQMQEYASESDIDTPPGGQAPTNPVKEAVRKMNGK
ncbi:S49 family peptidase [Tropicibacter sp. R16_0]|uniref:S49 family peptidase n=1 Tax=Tropicibacter sp. R16_0 TaxID=2821102 RepID=UPI001ADA6089|nr:S49 family peptidase [Tropicibacter sp. R16_0]MBO9451452.1 S49 family peptidase [Tropicibacter sp. R16_0]